jgi:hypothetical protein
MFHRGLEIRDWRLISNLQSFDFAQDKSLISVLLVEFHHRTDFDGAVAHG